MQNNIFCDRSVRHTENSHLNQYPDFISVTGTFSHWRHLKTQVRKTKPHMEKELRETFILKYPVYPQNNYSM